MAEIQSSVPFEYDDEPFFDSYNAIYQVWVKYQSQRSVANQCHVSRQTFKEWESNFVNYGTVGLLPELSFIDVDPDKDVDGFHPMNFGKMALDMSTFIPATPFGILELIERYKVETQGKHTVVIGRSHIVGRPMSILMGRKAFPGNSTVTVTHSRTKNIADITRQADIIISALGVPNFLKADMVKDDVVIIDVGITRVPDETRERGYRITGDVDFENVSKKASFITPVPGGVGPMTIAMLLKNTLLARERHLRKG